MQHDREQAVMALRSALGDDSVLWRREDLLTYEYDYGLDRARPDAVVFPRNAHAVKSIIDICRRHGVPIVARGAGTGISGGAIPVQGGVIVATSRMRRIVAIDPSNNVAVVEPGVINLDVSRAAAPHRLFFAPDPSSQKASTIGGNVANNAGGPHCLAYGVTTNHVLGLELVTVDGEIVTVGGGGLDSPGFDLTGLTVGSEGTFGIVTQVVVKLLPLPSAVRTLLTVFGSVADASRAVSDVIGARIIPTALELMDRVALQAIEAAFHAGYPPEAEAVLLIEVEGLSEAVDGQIERIETICRACSAIEIRVAATESERAALWAARKGAASAMGRIAPNYYLHDTVIARTRLPDVLAEVIAIGQRHELTIANLFHAGDGNLHPMIMFDVREPGALDRVMSAGHEILRACVAAGGTISGEHGIGIEKNEFMSWIFNEADLATMAKVRAAVDPIGLMNPGKVLPTGAPCMDTSTPRRVMEAAAVAAIAR